MEYIELIPEFDEILKRGWPQVQLTTEQQGILENAINILKLYDKEDVSYSIYYYENSNGEEFGSEYDTCTEYKCREASKKQIRADVGKGTRVYQVYTYNNGDHENIERCCICSCPLNNSLTWVKWEWDYWSTEELTADLISQSCYAFELRVLFESIPSADHGLSEYARNHKYFGYRSLQAQKDLYEAIVAKAQQVINIHNNEPIHS
jgi:hypothetical protein